jgi:hypothetical protein
MEAVWVGLEGVEEGVLVEVEGLTEAEGAAEGAVEGVAEEKVEAEAAYGAEEAEEVYRDFSRLSFLLPAPCPCPWEGEECSDGVGLLLKL